MPTQYAHVLKIKLNGVVFSKPIIDKYEDKIISTVLSNATWCESSFFGC